MHRPKRNFDNYGHTNQGRPPVTDGSDRVLHTRLGEVRVISFKHPIPPGFRKMLIEEGRETIDQLRPTLTTWSIIAFELGALVGPGYGNTLVENYGEECGEGFIIQC